MRSWFSVRTLTVLTCLPLLVFVIGSQKAAAQKTWQANVGAEPPDHSVQANAFFPNEVWIDAGDSIQWTFQPQFESHTVTFLEPNQVRPGFAGPPASVPHAPPVGCDMVNSEAQAQPDSPIPSYDGAGLSGNLACVNSGEMSDGATYTIKFPTPGNYKVVCLIHTDMNGTVHVLPALTPYPHDAAFYKDQGNDEARTLLSDNDRGNDSDDWANNAVIAGTGEIVATGGGLQYRSSMRFQRPVIYIHTGDSVTWTNLDPTEPHTITFGTEPAGFVPTGSALLGKNALDGTLTATIVCATTPCDTAYEPEGDQPYSMTTFISSGFIQAAAPDRAFPGAGVPPSGDNQVQPGTTRITITFPQAGDYYYHCALHDVNGMVGEVVVQNKAGDGDHDWDDR